jgi:xylulokinase
VRRADETLGPVLPWLREATGLEEGTLVVLGAGDEMAATLGAGVVAPGVVCDVLGTAEPVCAVVGEPAHDPTGVVELHPHADPETWLLENPGWLSGGAYRWLRDTLGVPTGRVALSGYSLGTAVAVELAREVGITLVGFLRGDGCNVYTCQERIVLPE